MDGELGAGEYCRMELEVCRWTRGVAGQGHHRGCKVIRGSAVSVSTCPEKSLGKQRSTEVCRATRGVAGVGMW